MWWKEVNQRYGMFQIGSPLFFHQNPVGFKNNIVTDIPELSVPSFTTINCPYYLSVSSVNNINLSQITGFSHWRWKSFFCNYASYRGELKGFRTRNCEAITVWTSEKQKKNRITSINAHRVFTKKLNVQTLAEFLNPNLESAATRWSHLWVSCPEKYFDVIKFHLKRNINVRETELVLKPKLFWLAASPDVQMF